MPLNTGAPLEELDELELLDELLDATELLLVPMRAEAALELVTTPEVVFLIQ